MNRACLLNCFTACNLAICLFPTAATVAQTQRRSASTPSSPATATAAAERAADAKRDSAERLLAQRGVNDRGAKEHGTGQKLAPPGRSVSLEFVIAEFVKGGKSAATVELDDPEKVLPRLQELEAAGEIGSLARYTLSSVELSPARLQFGERRPVLTSRGGFPGRGGGGPEGPASYSMENIGTIISSLSRVTEDGTVLAEITLERTRPSLTLTKESESDISRSRSSTTSAQTTITIPSGKWVVLGSGQVSFDNETSQSIVLVSAQVSDPVANKSLVRIFKLTHAEATVLASVVLDVMADDTVHIVADERTNSLIASSSTSNLQIMEALILRLDEAKQ